MAPETLQEHLHEQTNEPAIDRFQVSYRDHASKVRVVVRDVLTGRTAQAVWKSNAIAGYRTKEDVRDELITMLQNGSGNHETA